MSFLQFLGAGKAAGDAISTPIEAIGKTLDALFTSEEERKQAEAVMEKIRQKPAVLQTEINKMEAQHRTIFVAGARPFIMWVCGFGLMFSFLINPCLQWFTGDPGPELPLEVMMELVIAMLGLGVMRSFEKIGKVTK